MSETVSANAPAAPLRALTPANDPTFENVWDEIVWRGLVHVSTDQEALRELLSGDPITYYCGFDPTAPSLHLGNLVQLLTMRRLQLAGHRPLGLVGGSTGLIGDPRPTAERTLNTKDTVAEWVGYLRSQVERFLSFEGENAARMVNNLDWTAPLSAIDFLRDIGKYYRVGTMLKKDAVSARLNSEAGISYTEFSYQILQGMDFLELHRQYACVLQTGGSDQWGNLTSGVDLIHRVEGVGVHAIGTPLITNSDGTKFGKSEGNAIWLDAAMCSPYRMYQFWLNTADADVYRFMRFFTFLSVDEIDAIEAADKASGQKPEAQRILAEQATALVHGHAALEAAQRISHSLFSGSLDALTESDFEQLAQDGVPGVTLEKSAGSLIDALVAAKLAKSKSEARSFLQSGSVTVNGHRVDALDHQFGDGERLFGRFTLLRRGKKNYAMLHWI